MLILIFFISFVEKNIGYIQCKIHSTSIMCFNLGCFFSSQKKNPKSFFRAALSHGNILNVHVMSCYKHFPKIHPIGDLVTILVSVESLHSPPDFTMVQRFSGFEQCLVAQHDFVLTNHL